MLNELDAACEAYLHALGDTAPCLSTSALQAFHACQQTRGILRPEAALAAGDGPRAPWHAAGLTPVSTPPSDPPPHSQGSSASSSKAGMGVRAASTPLLTDVTFSDDASACMRCSKQLWLVALTLWDHADLPKDPDLWYETTQRAVRKTVHRESGVKRALRSTTRTRLEED